MSYVSEESVKVGSRGDPKSGLPRIPNQNIYYMLAYAWGILEANRGRPISAASFTCPIDFVAHELCSSCEALVRSHLAASFFESPVKSQRPKGRIDFNKTISDPAFARRIVSHSMPTTSINTKSNQIIKATLAQIKANREISTDVRRKASSLEKQLSAVSNIRLTRECFRDLQNSTTRSSYRLPLSLCEMLFFSISPSDLSGRLWFNEFILDEVKMRKLFEIFLKNFFAKQLKTADVRATKNALSSISGVTGDKSLIPNLNTDVVIDYFSGPKFIIDAKYTAQSTGNYFGKNLLRSSHLFQIFTYVSNFQLLEPGRPISGLVIYPQIKDELDVKFRYSKAIYRFASVDLSAHWTSIERRLLSLVSY